MSKRAPRRILIWTIVVIFIIGILGYIYFRSQALLEGPQITIVEPLSGKTFYTDLITISGTAENIAAITMNGQAVFVTGEGVFEEQLVLSPGYNIITVFGEDKFGKTTEKTLELYLDQKPDSLEIAPVTATETEESLEELQDTSEE